MRVSYPIPCRGNPIMRDNHHCQRWNPPNMGRIAIVLDAMLLWMVLRLTGWLVNSSQSSNYLSKYPHSYHRLITLVRFPMSHTLPLPQIHSIGYVVMCSIYVSHFDHTNDSSFRTKYTPWSSGQLQVMKQWSYIDSTNERLQHYFYLFGIGRNIQGIIFDWTLSDSVRKITAHF